MDPCHPNSNEQMKRTLPALPYLALAGLVTLGVAACGGGTDTPAADRDTVAVVAPGPDTAPMHGAGAMHTDAAMMERHAQEADSMAAAMRGHVQQMRQLSAEQQHDRIGAHVLRVSQMLNHMDRQMREMGMGPEHTGEMMGMSDEDHRRMMEEMRTLRTEAERLQIATAAQLREQMPQHLDRLERMIRMMEQSAAHMHGMH
jgi:hypothetical protein